MRCSSAVVLSTLAVGQAAAANVHNRHASFHARREAAKRGENDVNWNAVAYDLKDVKWDQVNWSSVFASTPAAKPTPTADKPKPAVAAAVTPTPEPKKDTPAPSSKPADTPKPSASSKPSSISDKIDDVVSDVFANVASIADAFNYKIGKNSKTDNGGIWLGSKGEYGMDVTNAGSDNAVWYCWVAPNKDYNAAFVSSRTPDISYYLAPGQSVSLNFPGNIGTACSPLKKGLPNPYGMIMNTWAEAHFGTDTPTFDVSRNPNMKGSTITMTGKKCTSDFQNCVFECGSGDSCTYGYKLLNCNTSNGGQGGFDADVNGPGGGCLMAGKGERLQVSFN